MTNDPLRDVAQIVDDLRAVHAKADALWNALPVESLWPVLNLRNEIENLVGPLEAIEIR